jgi:hypothetical protein
MFDGQQCGMIGIALPYEGESYGRAAKVINDMVLCKHDVPVPFDPYDRDYLLEHFDRHGADFGAETPEEYEAMADSFVGRRPIVPPLHDCIRSNGMRCFYDTQTQEYAVVYTWGIIATYFRPFAAGRLPEDERPDGSHGFLSNWEYFQAHC